MRAYVIAPGTDPGRAADLVETLLLHGIEVRRVDAELSLARGRSYLEPGAGPRRVPKGAYVVALDQPEKRMIQALFEPRTEQQAEFLAEQARKRAFNRARGANVPAQDLAFYDVTAWAMPYVQGVLAYASLDPVAGGTLLTAPPVVTGGVSGRARSAYLFDPRTLGSTRLAFDLLSESFKVAVAREDFTLAGRSWPSGTFVVRVERNAPPVHERLAALAVRRGVEVVATQTAWTEDGPDLGSFTLDSLKRPRIAVLADRPTDETAYGAIWYLLERRLGVGFTALRAEDLARADLSRYNVLVLPDGSASRYRRAFDEPTVKRLSTWIEDGGVVVASGGAAAFAADPKVGWTRARLLGPEPEPESDDDRAKAEKSADDKDREAEKKDPERLQSDRALRRQQERRTQETDFTPGPSSRPTWRPITSCATGTTTARSPCRSRRRTRSRRRRPARTSCASGASRRSCPGSSGPRRRRGCAAPPTRSTSRAATATSCCSPTTRISATTGAVSRSLHERAAARPVPRLIEERPHEAHRRVGRAVGPRVVRLRRAKPAPCPRRCRRCASRTASARSG